MQTFYTFICFVALLWVNENISAQQRSDRFKEWDKNNDGKLTADELPTQARKLFERMDADHDGAVTSAEFSVFLKSRQTTERQAEQPTQPTRSARIPTPTHADVSYGNHSKQAFDIWLAKSKDGHPTPLVIYIHGGGFRGGDKNANGQPIQDYLDQGISFASMNYRLSDVGPYPIMMNDAARGLQTIRSKAKEWNLNPDRVACYGGSAGAGISLWLGFHDDLADPNSDDPIARQSTRIVAAGTSAGQSTYDMRTFREWFGVPNLKPHPALVTFYAVEKGEDWESSERVKQLMTDASPIIHLTKDDVPVFMSYGKGDVVVDENTDPGVWVHHVRLGQKLKEAMDAIKLECHVTWPGHPSQAYKDVHAFLQKKVAADPR